jgi:hypothetical protein
MLAAICSERSPANALQGAATAWGGLALRLALAAQPPAAFNATLRRVEKWDFRAPLDI